MFEGGGKDASEEMRVILTVVLCSYCITSPALTFKTEKFKDEMNGKTKTLKSVISTDKSTTIYIQFDGYDKDENKVVVGVNNKILGFGRHTNIRVRVDDVRYSFGVGLVGDNYKEFIFKYACKVKEGSDHACLEDTVNYLLEDERLADLLIEAKRVKLELPLYRENPSIKEFR